MLNTLKLYNFEADIEIPNQVHDEGYFSLKTCQRTLLLTTNEQAEFELHNQTYQGVAAYKFLLEVICGLQSRLIGENEIVSQFKAAYKEFVTTPEKDTKLLLILEKLFKDAKEIRSKHLTGLSQKTYASITRKLIFNQNRAEEVVILGSGQLAQDLVNQFAKYTKVYITARNYEKLAKLQNIEHCHILPWKKRLEMHQYPFICNTIGFDGELLDQEFFDLWFAQHNSQLFIDLGAPSCIKTHFKSEHGVLRLDDILNEGAVHEEHKKAKLENAQQAIVDLATRRKTYLESKFTNERKKAL